MTRRIFIGDVQGCRAELEDLLREVGFDAAHDELHPVGDLVNRGPDSLGTLRLLRELDAGGVLGNHDLHLLRVAHGTRELRRGDTLREVLDAPDAAGLLAWLSALPFVRLWDDVVCVHAALHPHWSAPFGQLAGLDPVKPDVASDFCTRVRYCSADGARPDRDWPAPEAPFAPWYEHWTARDDEPRTAVYGHWARAGLVERERVRGLDTGCVWGGRLTAWIAEEDRIVSVPARRTWSTPGP